MDFSIRDKAELEELWIDTYNAEGRPDWSHIIPYYREDVFFKDSVQEIRGKKEFTAMTERLAKRSGSLEMAVRNSSQEGRIIFLEWVMTLRYKRYPKSSLYGSSRITLDDAGKIVEQRDYYDLWGDIFDNIPLFRRLYRAFMRWKFG